MILYGYYQTKTPFPLAETDYLLLSEGHFTTSVDNTEYDEIRCVNVMGNLLLYYINTNTATQTVVYNDNLGDWIDENYKIIKFTTPCQANDSYLASFNSAYEPSYIITSGNVHYKWNVPFTETQYKEFYLTDGNVYYSNGRRFTTLRYFYLTQELYYDDLLVYNGVSDVWVEGDEYQRIDFINNTLIPIQLYNFIQSNATQQYELTFIAPQLPMPFIDQIIGDVIDVDDFPYTQYETYDFSSTQGNYGKCILDGYYNDETFTSQITSSTITLTANKNVYLKFDKLIKLSEQKIILPNSISALNPFDYPEECNLNIKVYNNDTRYYGIKKDASNNLYVYKQDGTLIQLWTNNVPDEDEYTDLRISNIVLDVLNDILENSGKYVYDISYVTNTPTQLEDETWKDNVGTLPTIAPPSTQVQLLGWYYDSLFINQAHDNDPISSNVTLYAKFGLPTSIDIYLYENVDVNNSIRKIPTQKAIVSGTFKTPTSIVHPSVQIEYNKLDFNYAYIPQFNRYYYIDDIVVINNKLIQIECSCDVLMSFKSQLIHTYAIVSRNENDYNSYLTDERDTLEDGCNVTIVDAYGGDSISSSDAQDNALNIILMGVK